MPMVKGLVPNIRLDQDQEDQEYEAPEVAISIDDEQGDQPVYDKDGNVKIGRAHV